MADKRTVTVSGKQIQFTLINTNLNSGIRGKNTISYCGWQNYIVFVREALTMLDQLPEAVSDLNKIRKERGYQT